MKAILLTKNIAFKKIIRSVIGLQLPNRGLSNRSLAGLYRCGEWVKSIVNKFQKITVRFFPIERYFLVPQRVNLFFRQQFAHKYNITYLLRSLQLTPIQRSHITDIIDASKLLSGTILGKFSNKKIQNKRSTYLGYEQQENLSIINSILKTRSIKLKFSYTKLNVNKIGGEKLQFPLHPNTFSNLNFTSQSHIYPNNVSKLIFPESGKWVSSMWPDSVRKQQYKRDDSDVKNELYNADLHSLQMVFKRSTMQNITDMKPLSESSYTSESERYDSRSIEGSSPPVNIEKLTDKVLQQIDRKLLIWKERTGRV